MPAPTPARGGSTLINGVAVDAGTTADDLAYVRGRRLAVPVAGVRAEAIPNTYHAARSGGRVHRATDILAPRGTPVLAADDGRIWKLRQGGLGGITIYALDPGERVVYYYAHLDGYRTGLAEGQRIARGDTLGYVGTTGNAPKDVPHLHFQVAMVPPDRRWWTGLAVDPLPFLRDGAFELGRGAPGVVLAANRRGVGTARTEETGPPALRPVRPTVPVEPLDAHDGLDPVADLEAGAPERRVASDSGFVVPPAGAGGGGGGGQRRAGRVGGELPGESRGEPRGGSGGAGRAERPAAAGGAVVPPGRSR